jgi:hypothetical protein
VEGVVVLLGDVDQAFGLFVDRQSGVRRVSVPYWELSGQVTGLSVPRPICSGEQDASPCAAAGLTVIPSGKVTTAFFIGGVAMPLTLPVSA